jgi:hypothetical protein
MSKHSPALPSSTARWNALSSTRWSRNRGTALQPDIFAAPYVTVVAACRLQYDHLHRRHACRHRSRGVSDPGYNIPSWLLTPTTESAADAVSGEPSVSPLA